MSEQQIKGDAKAIIDAGVRSASPSKVGDNTYAIVVPEASRLELVDVSGRDEKYAANPLRKTGDFKVHDAASFVAYLKKHGLDESEVWADLQGQRIVGVINAHSDATTAADEFGPLPGWGDHRVTYAVQLTQAWKAWAGHDGKLLSQTEFADLIEDRSVDIVRPSAADMLELAQTFQATIGVSFESSKLLSSGERQLEYRETVDAKAGRKGTLEIPKDFDLALVPFEGADAFKVTARFRYRITDGVLRVGPVTVRVLDD